MNANVSSGIQAYPPQLYPQNIGQPAMPQQPTQAMPYVPTYQPVYGTVPYSSMYGQPQGCCSGKSQLSAVSINIEKPTVNAGPQLPMQPIYPGMTQMQPPVQQFVPPMLMPQYQPAMPNMMAMSQPMPAVIPQTQTVGSMMPAPVAPPPPQPQVQAAPVPQPQVQMPLPQQAPQGMLPPPQIMVPPAVPQPVATPQVQNNAVPTPPPPAIDNVPEETKADSAENKATDNNIIEGNTADVKPSDDNKKNEAVKPLVNALKVINSDSDENVSLDNQAKAIQTIAQFARAAQNANDLVKAKPDNEEAKQAKVKADTLLKPLLIKEDTFKGLAGVAVKDTSSLPKDEKKKADENRIISMWTLAMLQKLFRQEMNQEAKKINIPTISMNEIPGIVQVVNNVKSDPNPEVREAGIVALMNVADPKDEKDKETMKVILGTAAKQDKSANVKKAAKDAMKSISE